VNFKKGDFVKPVDIYVKHYLKRCGVKEKFFVLSDHCIKYNKPDQSGRFLFINYFNTLRQTWGYYIVRKDGASPISRMSNSKWKKCAAGIHTVPVKGTLP
jgi:hypothetical protein